MANWAWPHTPASHLARIQLVGGPGDGVHPAFVPPDTAAPVQVAWTVWLPGEGFAAFLYEWRGERTVDRGRTDALIYRCARRLAADEIPPLLAADAELWADGAAMIASATDVPPEMIWPGL